MKFPFGKGKIILQGKLKDESGCGRAPGHTRLSFKSTFEERILTNPFNITRLAGWVNLGKQIRKKLVQFMDTRKILCYLAGR
jgi:hypothetical protein